MRTGRALLAIVIATTACGSSSAASNLAACGPAGARTLAGDRVARIYAEGEGVYGCARAGAQSFRLGTSGPSVSQGRVGPVALAGADAAYGLTHSGVDTLTAQVVVRRLDTGRVLRRLAGTTGTQPPEAFQSVKSVVVKADGAVAWIAAGGSIIRPHSNTEEVDRSDRRGEATLERSTKLDLKSLRVEGSRLSWREGNAVRSATLL
jgi:hypothetical protein